MAAKKRTGRGPVKPAASNPSGDLESGGLGGNEIGVQTTGRMLVTFIDESRRGTRAALAAFQSRAGIAKVCHSSDFARGRFDAEQADAADAVVLDDLGIALMTGEPDRMGAVSRVAGEGRANVVVEPEYLNFALADGGLDDDLRDPGDGAGRGAAGAGGELRVTDDYLRGYQAGVNALGAALRGGGTVGADGAAGHGASVGQAAFLDTAAATWGLHATRVLESRFTGNGIKVAVLDTGFDLTHPDFAGRAVTGESFILGQTVQDGNGHGTHCIGTACGSANPGTGPRYGIAHGADIFAGKVLSNAGSGGDFNILAGINWAVRNRCEVVSMSLGRRVRPGEAPQTNYETAGRRALRAGTLIVAAAGNDSGRPFSIQPVSSPANARSIAAVAAVDARLAVARFSNGGVNWGGGEVNFAGPGVDVLSSWPMPVRLRTISGTSMATPHVAGIAALLAEENADARSLALYFAIRRRVEALAAARRDVGSGLARAV